MHLGVYNSPMIRSSTLSIAVVDPRATTRGSLCEILSSQDRAITFLPFESAANALTTAGICVDVFVFHVGSCSLLSEWPQRQLEAARPAGLPIIVLSDFPAPAEITSALNLGVSGYILTSFPPKVATCSIRLVAAGGEFFPAEALQNNVSHQASCASQNRKRAEVLNPAESLGFLTQRQRLVLHHLYYGKTNQQIAEAVGLSVGTVKVHVRNIMRKLKVHNRTQACAEALQIVRR
jgi:DNA-binding NarL/FixJ family response regulator